MPVEIKDGRILIMDENGGIALDTDERQFVWLDYVEGTVIVPSRVTYSQFGSIHDPISVNADTVLGDINPAATTVFGAIRVSYVNVGGSSFDSLQAEGWFQATGSFILPHIPTNSTGNISGGGSAGTPSTPWTGVCSAVAYTFRAAGGHLIFNEQAQTRPFSLALGSTEVASALPEVTIDYKLYCGSFF